jgi:hypothetical protein
MIKHVFQMQKGKDIQMRYFKDDKNAQKHKILKL